MKKIIITFMVLITIILTGCENQFVKKLYKVTFISDAENLDPFYLEGENITFDDVKEVLGCDKFGNFDINNNDSYDYRVISGNFDPNSNIFTITVKKLYKITFNPNGGTPTPEPQYLVFGQLIEKPINVSKENYIIAFWADENSNTWNFKTMTVERDMTLKAWWAFPNE